MAKKEAKPQADNRTRYGFKQLPYDELDTTPVAMPANASQPPTMEELIAKYLRIERMREEHAKEEPETWEEANDFEEEDPDTLDFSPYELQELQEELETGYKPDPPPQEAQEAPNVTPPSEQSENGGIRALTDAENRSADQGEPSEATR